MNTGPSPDVTEATRLLNLAASKRLISESAVENILTWLSQPRYSPYLDNVVEHIQRARWSETGIRVLDSNPVWHCRPSRKDVPHWL